MQFFICVFTLKFTVLSDTPENEQELECEDTDFAGSVWKRSKEI